MERDQEQQPEVKAQGQGASAPTEEVHHHYAAPEVEEWKPHPYAGEGLHRRESLKGDVPEDKEKHTA